MTLYARSDLACENLAAAHGGAVRSIADRTRAERTGEALGADLCPCARTICAVGSLWSTTVAEIPETHDEQSEREDYEKRGANDIQTMMALALTRMTGGEVPDTVARMIDGSKLHLPAQVKVLCPPHGHANPPGVKFCGECAAPMRDAAPAGSLPPAPPAPDLADLHPQKLRKMCREKGLDDSGTRPEMIARLEVDRKVAV